MEKEYPCRVVQVALECVKCRIPMTETNNQSKIGKYVYKCDICGALKSTDKQYPYEKIIRQINGILPSRK